jgi:hypothetical protein
MKGLCLPTGIWVKRLGGASDAIIPAKSIQDVDNGLDLLPSLRSVAE